MQDWNYSIEILCCWKFAACFEMSLFVFEVMLLRVNQDADCQFDHTSQWINHVSLLKCGSLQCTNTTCGNKPWFVNQPQSNFFSVALWNLNCLNEGLLWHMYPQLWFIPGLFLQLPSLKQLAKGGRNELQFLWSFCGWGTNQHLYFTLTICVIQIQCSWV